MVKTVGDEREERLNVESVASWRTKVGFVGVVITQNRKMTRRLAKTKATMTMISHRRGSLHLLSSQHSLWSWEHSLPIFGAENVYEQLGSREFGR